MKIAVTGSLGRISRPLARLLIQNTNKVIVISSDEEKRKDIEFLGAEAAIGSLDDVAFLTKTFHEADAVYLMVPPNFTVPDSREYYRKIGNAYAEAIRQSGVRRIVHLSSMGAELDHGTGFILGSHDVEGILNTLPDVSVTHLRPGYFFYNLNNFAGMIKGIGAIATNYGGDDNMVLAYTSDIAEAAAEEFEHYKTGNNVRYVVSDERKASDIAKVLGKAIGKPNLQWNVISNEEVQQGMLQQGMPPHTVAGFVEMGAAIHSRILYKDYEQNKPDQFGAVKLEDFAKEFVAVYSVS